MKPAGQGWCLGTTLGLPSPPKAAGSRPPKKPTGALVARARVVAGGEEQVLTSVVLMGHCVSLEGAPAGKKVVSVARGCPEQASLVKPRVLPMVPEGHSWQALALVLPLEGLNVPRGHSTCLGAMLRAGQ